MNYDSNLWSKLATALAQTNFSSIPEVSRAQIVSDGFNLARGGYISYSQLFSVIEFLANDTSYHVWYSALSGFEYLVKRAGLDSTLGAAIAVSKYKKGLGSVGVKWACFRVTSAT